jgi:UDP-glucose 4-epimerase
LCRAILLALESKVAGEVFQVAIGVETSIIELAALVQDTVGQGVGMHHGPPRQGDIRKNYSTIEKVRRMLGWEPEVSLAVGLREVWAWFNGWMGDGR